MMPVGWVVIPSRAGTKNKGLWLLAGHTLLDWVLKQTEGLPGCVTSDQHYAQIAADNHFKGFVSRPTHLRCDEGLEWAVLHALDMMEARGVDFVHLVQPTSPFITRARIEEAEAVLRTDARVQSVQTVARIPHNFHEWNQRAIKGNEVSFVHEEERRNARIKQAKPARFSFGNLVSTRVQAMREHRWFFERPSRSIEISAVEALDVDDREALATAEAYVQTGMVRSPFS